MRKQLNTLKTNFNLHCMYNLYYIRRDEQKSVFVTIIGSPTI